MPGEFVFVPTHYSPELQSELAKALRARTEIVSRKKNPRLWRMTDGVNHFAEANRADDPVLKRRKLIQTVLSVILAAMGVFLLVTGLMEPRDTTLLAAGVIALVIAAARFLPKPDASMTRQFQKSASLLLKSLGAKKTNISYNIISYCHAALPDISGTDRERAWCERRKDQNGYQIRRQISQQLCRRA